MDESLQICRECAELFRSQDAPKPGESRPAATVESDVEEPRPEVSRAPRPISGLELFIFSVLIYIFGRLVAASSQGPQDTASAAISLGLICAAFIIGVIGIVRLCIDSFSRK